MRHIILFQILAVCLLCSCSENTAEHSGPKDKVYIRLRLAETDETKFPQNANDILVSDINLFLFDEKGNLATSLYAEKPGQEIAVDLNTGYSYSVYAVANTGDMTSRKETLTQESIEGMELIFNSPIDIVGENGELPMSGKTHTGILNGGETISVSLTRLVSKFRIRVDTTGLDKDVSMFDIQQIVVNNINRYVNIFNPCRIESTNNVAGGIIRFTKGELQAVYGEGLDVYVPENLQGNLLPGNTDQSKHVPPSPYDRLCTFIVFYVSYRSSEHYGNNLTYRFYLHDGNRLDNFDVARNTMYDCTVSFAGTGLSETSWRVYSGTLKDYVTSITITPSEYKLFLEDYAYDFKAEVLPGTAANKSVTWSSENENIVKVSSYGDVTAVNDGTCRIIATANDGSGVSGYATIHVYINSKAFEIYNFPDTLFPNYNTPYKFDYYSYPDPIGGINMSSEAKRIMEFRNDTLFLYNHNKVQGDIGIHTIYPFANGILAKLPIVCHAGFAILDRSISEVYVGTPVKLKFKRLMPADVSIKWSTSDPSVATVSYDGTLTPHKAGTCTITAESITQAFDTMEITVLDPS
ncbi:MAG TPA: Ig-like domain-containing protein [Candidatus Coprenecus stercoravium]|uniref:Ig-like domain-containing protein n=1 Tax=Candidatus Coprenecus stercoravium TaxID=2840735 RepID=A0A9D2GSS5_9BACT|nr:Ig-like domain-containing protein [Candidatus Coprenecus stercoravium]